MNMVKSLIGIALVLALVLALVNCSNFFLRVEPAVLPPAGTVTVTALDLTSKITAPEKNAMPVTAFTVTAEYSGTVQWKDSGDVNHSGNFATGAVYKAVVTLNALSGFTFIGVAANSFTYTGATITNTTGSGNVMTVIITFPSTTAVSSISIDGAPTKTAYGLGEPFDLTGLTLTVTYSDLTFDTGVAITASMLSPANWNTTADTGKSITVTCGGKTANIAGIGVYNIVAKRGTTYAGYNTLPAAFSGESGQTSTITLYADETVNSGSNITLSGSATDITLTGYGGMRTITGYSDSHALFTIDSGASLTLGIATVGTTITITGHTNSGGIGGGVYVDNGGSFTMNGGTISRNTSSWGGGVYVDRGGSFDMNRGEISSNTAGYSGGGVFVSDAGVFVMVDGTITDNIVNRDDGGGVFVDNGGMFSTALPIEEGNKRTHIYNNTPDQVSVDGTGTIGGTISDAGW